MTATFSNHTGDVLRADERVVAHGCNTRGVMGAGIAKQVRDMHPNVYRQYVDAVQSLDFVLGTAQLLYRGDDAPGALIFNLGTQNAPGPNATLWAVYLSFANLAEMSKRCGIDRVAIPRIGCGIGGLIWYDVRAQIERAVGSAQADIHFAVYDL